MSTLLVAAAVVAVFLGIVILVIGARLMRSNHTRQLERIHALQELASAPQRGPAHHDPVHHEPAPQAKAHSEDVAWDLQFRDHQPAKPIVAAATPQMLLAPAQQAAPRPDLSGFIDVRSATPNLFEEPTAPTGRRWGAFAAGVLILAMAAGVAYVLSTGIVGEIVTASSARSSEPAFVTVAAPIELLSLRHASEATDAFVVTGLVQNPAAGGTLRGVFAMVYLFDNDGRYFASSKAALDATTLSAGGQSAFTVRVPATSGVTKYRVSFQLEDGAAVNHVDRRGSLPEHTTGDAVTTPEKGKRP